jgi:hypothetical protein
MAYGRFYDFPNDPRSYVSVTTFLGVINKPFLMTWAAKMERELIRKLAEQDKSLQEILEYLEPKQPYGYQLYTETTSSLGSNVHKAIDYTLKKLKLPKLNDREQAVYNKWLNWWSGPGYGDGVNSELLAAEQVVKHEGLGYAGTLDALVVTQDKRKLILDWKTGKNHYAEHVLQNLAYQHAMQEEVDGGLLVYVRDEGKPVETHPVPAVTPELFQPVLDALSLWRWANNKPWPNG